METKNTRSGATRLDSRPNLRGRISKHAVSAAAALASLALVGNVRADKTLWTYPADSQGWSIWFGGGSVERDANTVGGIVPADPNDTTTPTGALEVDTAAGDQTYTANFNHGEAHASDYLSYQNLSLDIYLPSVAFNAASLNVRMGAQGDSGPSTAGWQVFNPEVNASGGVNADITKLDQWQTLTLSIPAGIPSSAVNSTFLSTYLIYNDGAAPSQSFEIDNLKLINPVVVPPINATWVTANDGDWSSTTNWVGGQVPNAVDNTATFGSGNSVARSVTISQQETVGTINFSSSVAYNLSGATGTIVLSSATAAGINVTAGNHSISAAVSMPGDASFNISASSSLTLTKLQTQFGTLNKTGPGTLAVNPILHNTVQVNGGTLKLVPSTGTSSTFFLGLNAPGVVLDITNNSVTAGYGDANTLQNARAQIQAGFNGGAWNGTSVTLPVITSATAAAVAANGADAHKSGIGYADGAVLGSNVAYIGGTTPDNTSGAHIIYSYTLYGDANLDGTVSTADFSMLAGGFGMNSGSQVWTSGDFNYDGVVNALDFNMLAANYGATLPQSAPVLGALVPEPTSLATLILGGALLGRTGRSRRMRAS